MQIDDFYKNHWNYYLSLEQDVLSLERFIMFEEDNFNVYSNKMIQLYLSICSEVDVTFKVYCKFLESSAKLKNIEDYKKILLSNRRELPNLIVEKEGIAFIPFAEWSKKKGSLLWWVAHNKVKHDRMGNDNEGNANYKKANLKNVLISLAALFVLNMAYYRDLINGINGYSGSLSIRPRTQSNLFIIKDWDNYENLKAKIVRIQSFT